MAMHRVSGARWLRCALAATALAASAQIAGATVRGSITTYGEPTARASVVATNTATGLIVRTISNASGEYVLAGLPPGTYWIVVTGAGPAHSVQRITVRVGQNVSLNLTLDQQPLALEPVVIASTRANDDKYSSAPPSAMSGSGRTTAI